MKINQYFPYEAEILEGGVLRVHWCGTDCLDAVPSLCTGVYDISPDNPDYKFWLWLKARDRRKKPWFRLMPPVGFNEQAIAESRQQFERECG